MRKNTQPKSFQISQKQKEILICQFNWLIFDSSSSTSSIVGNTDFRFSGIALVS